MPLHSVFGGVVMDRLTGSIVGADSIVVTYFLANDHHSAGGWDHVSEVWGQIWTDVVGRSDDHDQADSTNQSVLRIERMWVGEQEVKHLYYKSGTTPNLFSGEALVLSLSYLIVFLYISLVVGRVDLVKSKFALGFGAVFAVVCSMLMSVGLCSLIGVKSTLVPWEVLPFLIIAVGVENIFVLTNAVVMTSLDLPVKERVGLGLAKVGVQMSMSLFGEMFFLLTGSLIGVPALQEFCLFGAVSIVMDYFLQITFFTTILSIDIRRLELSELHKLRRIQIAQAQNQTAGSNGSISSKENKAGEKKQIPWRAWLITLAFMILLGFGFHRTAGSGSGPLNSIPSQSTKPEHSMSATADVIWDIIDPSRSERYVEIRPPTYVTFASPRGGDSDSLQNEAPIPNPNDTPDAPSPPSGPLAVLRESSPTILTALVVLLLLLGTLSCVILTSCLYTLTRVSSSFSKFHWTHVPTRPITGQDNCNDEWKSAAYRLVSIKASTSTDVEVVRIGSGGVVAWSCLDGKVQWWDAGNGERIVVEDGCRKRKRGNRDRVECLGTDEVGLRVVGGTGSGAIRVWDVETGDVAVFDLADGQDADTAKTNMAQVGFGSSSDGDEFMFGASNSGLHVWNSAHMSETLLRTVSPARCCFFEPRGRIFAGCEDGGVRSWSAVACPPNPADPSGFWKSWHTFSGHAAPVVSITCDASAGVLVTGATDGEVRVWDIEARTLLLCYTGDDVITNPRETSASPTSPHTSSPRSRSTTTQSRTRTPAPSITSLALHRARETFASSTYTLAISTTAQTVHFLELELSLPEDEGRSIPSVRRRNSSATSRRDSLSRKESFTNLSSGDGSGGGSGGVNGANGTGMDGTSPSVVAPWIAKCVKLGTFEQEGCTCIGVNGAMVVGARRVAESASRDVARSGDEEAEADVEWWWELWMVDLSDSKDPMRVVRRIKVGRDEVGGFGSADVDETIRNGGDKFCERAGGGGMATEGIRRRLSKSHEAGGVDKSVTEEQILRLPKRRLRRRRKNNNNAGNRGVASPAAPVPSPTSEPTDNDHHQHTSNPTSSDDDNDDTSSATTTDTDDTPLPVLSIRSVVASSWGIAIGFGNFVKIVVFDESDGSSDDEEGQQPREEKELREGVGGLKVDDMGRKLHCS
ncbi:hypothetical protein HK104_006324 [Borealophlyctis nickersoniae]|nr:hypothetical protein HK104_006324 [Borealophlyctis nickersoniae]